MIKGQKVYVVHVPRTSAQGRHTYEYKRDDGTTISMGRTRSKGISIPFSFVRNGNQLVTGLDELIDNPYYELSKEQVNFGSNWFSNFDTVTSQKQITLQMLYEIMDDMAVGTYTSTTNTPVMSQIMNDVKIADRLNNQSELEQFKIWLQEGTNVFSSDTSRGRLAIQLLKNHPKIALDKNQVNENIHEFYIAEEEEAIKEANKKIDIVMDGLTKLGLLFANYDMFTRYQLSVIMDLVTGEASDSLVEMSLKNHIWEQRKVSKGTQDERIIQFLEQYDLLLKDKDKVYIRYMIQQAINTGIFYITGGKHFWRSQKGIENLYNLGASKTKIENMLYQEMEAYDPDLTDDNVYHKLLSELKQKGIKCR